MGLIFWNYYHANEASMVKYFFLKQSDLKKSTPFRLRLVILSTSNKDFWKDLRNYFSFHFKLLPLFTFAKAASMQAQLQNAEKKNFKLLPHIQKQYLKC